MITMLLLLPLIFAGVIMLLPDVRSAKVIALIVSLVTTFLSLMMWLSYDLMQGGFQFLAEVPWIPNLGINYIMALDGLSLPFVFLTALLTSLAIMSEWQRRSKSFFALFLLLQVALTAVFASLDLMLFFIAFELTLIPMFFIIGIWGYDNRRYAAIKFLLYSLFGSVFLLVAILTVAFLTADGPVTFDYRDILANVGQLSATTTLLLCLGFAIAFLIKLPAFPLHTWLPHAHTEAPTAGSIMLAGVLLKMGGYGLIRFNVSLFPEAMQLLQPVLAALAVIGILYGGYVALGQTDLKKLVAYSSVNHMGFSLLGIASLSAFGLQGAVYQMIAHGVITGLLFMLIGMLSQRTHTRSIAAMTGIYSAMPLLGGLLWFAMLGGAGIPGLAGFIGEFQALLGAFQQPGTSLFASLAVFGILINAGLMLWAIQRVLQGTPSEQMRANYDFHDLGGLELAAAIPLVFLALLWGLWPPALSPMLDAGLVTAMEAVQQLSHVAGVMP